LQEVWVHRFGREAAAAFELGRRELEAQVLQAGCRERGRVASGERDGHVELLL
jgi:hypothetical protein